MYGGGRVCILLSEEPLLLLLSELFSGDVRPVLKGAELAFAALSNDVPTVAVVVPDLAAKSLFPLLGRHDSCRDLEPF